MFLKMFDISFVSSAIILIKYGYVCSPCYSFLLTLTPPNKLSIASFLFCFNFQSFSMPLNVGENVVLMSNRLDPDVMPSYSASNPDPSCLHIAFSCVSRLWLIYNVNTLYLDIIIGKK